MSGITEPFGPDEDDDVVKLVSSEMAENRSKLSSALPNRRITNFVEAYYSKEHLRFLIEDVIPESGIVFFGGLSGTGKTVLAIQVTVNLVLRRETMTWKPVEDMPIIKALMLSLEMNQSEFQRRVHDMYPKLDESDEKTLQENFLLYADPEPFKLWDDTHSAELVTLIASNGVNVVLIDSASVAFAENLNDITQVNKSLQNLHMIRTRLNVAIIVVAHTRKPPAGMSSSPEEASINELFGHSGVAQWGSSIFVMMEDENSRRKAIKEKNGDKVDKIVHVINVKTRFGSSNAAFKTKLPSREATKDGSPLQFRRDAIELPPLSQEDRRRINQDKTPLSETLAAEGIDLGSMFSKGDEV